MATKQALERAEVPTGVRKLKAGQEASGWIEPPPPQPVSEEDLPEELTEMEKIEKKVVQRITRLLIPSFPDGKLERMKLKDIMRLYNGYEMPDILTESLKEEMLRRYKDLSP